MDELEGAVARGKRRLAVPTDALDAPDTAPASAGVAADATDGPRRVRVRVRPSSARKRILDEQTHVWFTREWIEIDPDQLRGRRGDLDLEVEEI